MDKSARTCTYAALAVLLAGLAGVTAVQYMLPDTFRPSFGTHALGMRHFKHALGLDAVPLLPSASFRTAFRAGLALMYAAYVVMLVFARRLECLPVKKALAAVAVVACATAVFFPPSLSCDIYTYVGYARMASVHHLNPYFQAPHVLIALGDPVAALIGRVRPLDTTSPIKWDLPTVYGPVWTVVSTAITAAEPGASVWVQTVCMKLIEALALVLATYAAWRAALKVSPRTAPAILLSVGFNPLFLIEGPGSGHNDLLLMSLVMLAAWLSLEEKAGWAALALGGSIGIKFITVAVVPWLLWEHRRRLLRPLTAVGIIAALILPTLLTFVPYWHGPQTLASVVRRGSAHVVAPTVANTMTYERPSLAQAVRNNSPLIIAYVAVTALLVGLGIRGWWLAAWAILSIFYFVEIPARFPWYVIWMWSTAACRWNRLHLNLCGVAGATAFAFTWCYTITNNFLAADFIVDTGLLTAMALLALNYREYKLSLARSSTKNCK